mmetsp:Transcript_37916/g.107696  ORF Transcript_37916/g.107696 Transcript_37916/m.107696 type:complete len:207 (-) Transcript_37916:920-1540(-)
MRRADHRLVQLEAHSTQRTEADRQKGDRHNQDAYGEGEAEPLDGADLPLHHIQAREDAVGGRADERGHASTRRAVGNREQHRHGELAARRARGLALASRCRGFDEACSEGHEHHCGCGVAAPHGEKVTDHHEGQHHNPRALDADLEQDLQGDPLVQVDVLDGDVHEEGPQEQHLDPTPIACGGHRRRADAAERHEDDRDQSSGRQR